jgi:hypothetical protein
MCQPTGRCLLYRIHINNMSMFSHRHFIMMFAWRGGWHSYIYVCMDHNRDRRYINRVVIYIICGSSSIIQYRQSDWLYPCICIHNDNHTLCWFIKAQMQRPLMSPSLNHVSLSLLLWLQRNLREGNAGRRWTLIRACWILHGCRG